MAQCIWNQISTLGRHALTGAQHHASHVHLAPSLHVIHLQEPLGFERVRLGASWVCAYLNTTVLHQQLPYGVHILRPGVYAAVGVGHWFRGGPTRILLPLSSVNENPVSKCWNEPLPVALQA